MNLFSSMPVALIWSHRESPAFLPHKHFASWLASSVSPSSAKATAGLSLIVGRLQVTVYQDGLLELLNRGGRGVLPIWVSPTMLEAMSVFFLCLVDVSHAQRWGRDKMSPASAQLPLVFRFGSHVGAFPPNACRGESSTAACRYQRIRSGSSALRRRPNEILFHRLRARRFGGDTLLESASAPAF